MAQHFLLSAKARTLSIGAVMRMTDDQAEAAFIAIRWAKTEGKPVCPHCECHTVYECRRPNGSARWRCNACRKDFSVTSGTLFAFHKMPLRTYLAAIVIFCNEVKGKSALALSRDLDCQCKTAFVLAHKLREAMASDVSGLRLGGPGKVAEVDGAYFGGYVKPSNLSVNRRDRRFTEHKSGKRQVVVVVRERNGRTAPAVFKSESAALGFIASRVARGTHIVADEAAGWNALGARYAMSRVDHQEGYSVDGVYTNGAEVDFSRVRRAEIGHHHHISGPYLARYAQEGAWREDARRVDNGLQVRRVAGLALANRPSVDFCGYWQRAQEAA